jgi:enoyl-CoA hydratase
VDRLTETGGALTGALEIAEVIARNAPLAVRTSKRVMQDGFTKEDSEFWEWQKGFYGTVFASEDALEGARAFAEKRPAQWKGK